MKRIDRLLLQARSSAPGGMELIAAFIAPSGDSWTAAVHLHDGVPGHQPAIEKATWATMNAAVEHVRAMAEKYPNSRDVPVIIADIPR